MAVGAVYDPATFASEWAKCAVIERAYSGIRLESHVPLLTSRFYEY